MNAKLALVRPRFVSDLDPLAALWIVRLSATFAEAFRLLSEGIHADNLREMVGIAPMIGPLPRTGMGPILKARADELVLLLPSRKTNLASNVDLLGELLGINAMQKQILMFTALSKHHPLLTSVVENIRTTNMDALRKLLAVALGVRHADISQALRYDGLLFMTRIVSVENNYDGGDLKLKMPTGLTASMFTKADNIQMLMNSFLENAPLPDLTAKAFPHLIQETELLTAYLSNTVKTHTRGSNVLIYGKPGTGKTEYVRWLAASLGKLLYQVRSMDDQGDPISGLDRLSFYQLSQAFLQKSNAIMLFDEIEDIFQSNSNPFDRVFHNLAPTAGE